ncbi:hypothetical protein ABZ922_01915 [Streptomyces shenzhenensis]
MIRSWDLVHAASIHWGLDPPGGDPRPVGPAATGPAPEAPPSVVAEVGS